jgi:hypothetical protein
MPSSSKARTSTITLKVACAFLTLGSRNGGAAARERAQDQPQRNEVRAVLRRRRRHDWVREASKRSLDHAENNDEAEAEDKKVGRHCPG